MKPFQVIQVEDHTEIADLLRDRSTSEEYDQYKDCLVTTLYAESAEEAQQQMIAIRDHNM